MTVVLIFGALSIAAEEKNLQSINYLLLKSNPLFTQQYLDLLREEIGEVEITENRIIEGDDKKTEVYTLVGPKGKAVFYGVKTGHGTANHLIIDNGASVISHIDSIVEEKVLNIRFQMAEPSLVDKSITELLNSKDTEIQLTRQDGEVRLMIPKKTLSKWSTSNASVLVDNEFYGHSHIHVLDDDPLIMWNFEDNGESSVKYVSDDPKTCFYDGFTVHKTTDFDSVRWKIGEEEKKDTSFNKSDCDSTNNGRTYTCETVMCHTFADDESGVYEITFALFHNGSPITNSFEPYELKHVWLEKGNPTKIDDIWLANPIIVENYSTQVSASQEWLDRNLGATRVAVSMIDSEAYGDLYQWGRAADGHHKRNSSTTTMNSSTDSPGHTEFILESASPYDWRSPQNDSLWQGTGGTNNPCPDGFRLPTNVEFETERTSWSANNAAGAFNSPLKFVLAGMRNHNNGTFTHVGSFGQYWSSTVNGIYSHNLNIRTDSAKTFYNRRAEGFSVRCIKD